jgi:ATP phosphoribosyltransferase regulatory subunit
MPDDAFALSRQTPHGLTDLYAQEAADKTALEDALQETFRRWGYQRIILPTFEYDETLSTGASAELRREMYRFFDREGHVLALRPDMTVPTARVVGTKLYDQELPLRLYYVGNVFRHEEPQAGRRREFTQAGIELIGAGTPQADAEVVAVAVAALRAMGIAGFQINLGQVAYLQAMLSEVRLANGQLDQLEQAVDRKNDVELQRVLSELGLSGDLARAILALPHLCGDEAVLDEAARLATNPAAREAIERLRTVYGLLRVEGVADLVTLDLGEVRRMAYYTGISFLAYVENLGFSICSGGRYDGLLRNFGADLPAVGFALGVERCLLVTQPGAAIAPDLVMRGCTHAGCRALANRARSLGLRVRVDVLQRDEAALIAYARSQGARYTLSCRGADEYMLVESDCRRTLTRTALEKEMAAWKR